MLELLLANWPIKLAVLASCVVLKLIGELWWHNAQRYILPVIFSAAMSYLSGLWWLGFTTLPMIGALVLGYKDYGKNDAVARALWLFVICVVASLGPTILGYISWFFFVPYIIASGFVGTTTRNINNLIGAPLNGLTIGLPILFVHHITKIV